MAVYSQDPVDVLVNSCVTYRILSTNLFAPNFLLNVLCRAEPKEPAMFDRTEATTIMIMTKEVEGSKKDYLHRL